MVAWRAWVDEVRERVTARVERLQRGRQPARSVGLDLGSHGIKLVEVEQTSSGYRLVKSLIQDLPWNTAAPPAGGAAAAPVDQIGWLQAALKEFAAAGLHVSLSGPEAALRRLQLPLMTRRELMEAARWQVKDQLTFPVQDAVIDVQVLGEVWAKDIKKLDVLVAVASQAAVRAALELVEQAGGCVMSLTPEPLALWRSVQGLMPEARSGSVAIIEIGAVSTRIAIAHQGRLRLVRDLAIGSATVTEALVGVVTAEQGEVTIDSVKAEALKRRYGVVKDTAEGTTDDGVPLFHLSALMRPVLEQLVTEISRVLDFYRMQLDEAGVGRLLLCGGGANLKQLRAFLADGLGMNAELWNPLLRMPDRVQALEPEQVAENGPRLAVAIGLAIEHGQSFRLMTSKPQPRRVRLPQLSLPPQWPRLAAAAAGIAAGLGLLWMLAVAGLTQLQVQAEERRWVVVEPTFRSWQQAHDAAGAAEAAIARLQQFTDQEPVWDGVLKELGKAMPATVELDELACSQDVSRGRLRAQLKGRVTFAGRPERILAQLVEALNRSIFFEGVELASSTIRAAEGQATSFELAGWLE